MTYYLQVKNVYTSLDINYYMKDEGGKGANAVVDKCQFVCKSQH